jgi:hypothetical protein
MESAVSPVQAEPRHRALQPGDKVGFYLGIPHKAFSASAVLASPSFSLSPAEQEELSHGMGIYRALYGVRLNQTLIWEHPHRVEDLLPALGFIENKEYWGSYFQGGVRQLGERDFQIIYENAVPATPIISPSVPSLPSPHPRSTVCVGVPSGRVYGQKLESY